MPYRRLALCLLLLVSSLLAPAQRRAGTPKVGPQNTVREFCRLDFLGGRLSAEGWAPMKPLAAWNENPAWRRFRIVSRYEQTDQVDGTHSSRIMVQYQVLGAFELGIGYTPVGGSQDVEFKLKESDDQWRIESTEPVPFDPHVSKARAIQWLQDKLKGLTDPGDKVSVETALKQLQAVRH